MQRISFQPRRAAARPSDRTARSHPNHTCRRSSIRTRPQPKAADERMGLPSSTSAQPTVLAALHRRQVLAQPAGLPARWRSPEWTRAALTQTDPPPGELLLSKQARQIVPPAWSGSETMSRSGSNPVSDNVRRPAWMRFMRNGWRVTGANAKDMRKIWPPPSPPEPSIAKLRRSA